ncbi:MAG: hypothetical protein AAF389_11150 [Gemmatimonadota bacterium]
MSRVIPATAASLAALVTIGCFSEGPTEVAPTPDPLVVVQGVVRPDQDQQWILVEKTFNGTTTDFSSSFVPGGNVEVPASGASVTMTNLTLTTDPCGASTMTEAAAPVDVAQPGVYFTSVGCPAVRPGDTLALRVVLDGDTMTARTVIPMATTFTLRGADTEVTVPGPRMTFNRDADTLRLAVDGTEGRMLLLEIGERRFGATPSFIADNHAQFWVDGTEISLPGDAPNIFEDFDEDLPIPPIFRAGRYYRITTAWTDQNFMDQLRSENSEITGRGYINSIEGGYGYFGSLLAGESTLRVVGDADEPYEGAYTLTGTVDSVAVDLAMELYRNGTFDGLTEVSGFFEGDWVLGSYDAWAPGSLIGDGVNISLFQPTGAVTPEGFDEIRRWEVRGRLNAGQPATLAVVVDGVQVGTVVATPVS